MKANQKLIDALEVELQEAEGGVIDIAREYVEYGDSRDLEARMGDAIDKLDGVYVKLAYAIGGGKRATNKKRA